MTAPVELRDLNHRFGTFEALTGIDLAIEAGEYVTLLGPSGCGKTTMLSIMGGFLEPTEGQVLIGGRDVTALPPAKRPTTTVFQDYALFPHMSVAENVAFGLRMAGMGRRERRARAGEALALVGLADAGDKRPHALSGGQRQRVALARALAVEPDVLLLDEPLGALDLKLRRAMQDELKAIQRKIGTTFVHVTHDQEEAMAISDRIVIMNTGRIEDEGPPARVYRRPATRFAASFMGEINLFTGRTGPPAGDVVRVGTPLGPLPVRREGGALPTSVAVKVGIRPEAFRAPAGEDAIRLPVTVTGTAFFGTHHRIHAEARPTGHPLVAHLPPSAEPRPGEAMELSLPPGEIVLIPDHGHREDP